MYSHTPLPSIQKKGGINNFSMLWLGGFREWGLCLSLFFLFAFTTSAQTRYRVYFKDKNTTFNPHSYFDAKAISRRVLNNLSLNDSTDFPVNPTYLTAVTNLADSIGIISRWFNFITVYTSDEQVAEITKLPFVSKVYTMQGPLFAEEHLSSHKYTIPVDSFLKPGNAKLLRTQIDMMQGREFTSNRIDGKGVRIAIFDAGFPNVPTATVFSEIVKEKRIIATYNFGRKNNFVYSYNTHGAMVMACIGGKTNGRNIGLASGAEFLLAITENPNFEAYKEEENWLAAAEWADKNGADIINSSLGYTNDLYFTEDMNGRNSLIGRAATMAVKKGILVVSSAGNEGQSNWEIVASPGDADSVLTIGAIDPFTGYHANYSSYGPNRNFKIKPNVSAAGTVVSFDKNRLGVADGTSFASPLVAGFAACALQTDTALTTTQLYKKIEQSASLYPYFDYAHGYGIPQAGYFTGPKKTTQPTFKVAIVNGKLSVSLDSIYFAAAKEKNEKLVFYHIQNPNGVLDKYFVILAEKIDVLDIDTNIIDKGSIVRIHYKGYTFEYTIPD